MRQAATASEATSAVMIRLARRCRADVGMTTPTSRAYEEPSMAT
jgi:hypothetical protein